MKYLTTKEVAELCRVSVRTVENWRCRGQGPRYICLGTGQIRYPADQVLRFINYYRSPAPKPFKRNSKHWEALPND